MSMGHHFLMQKRWHPASKENRALVYKKEMEEKERKKRDIEAREEFRKRREKYLFNKMAETGDGKNVFNDIQLDLDFMYAVPKDIEAFEKQEKAQEMDKDVARFKALYLDPHVVSEIPETAEVDTKEKDEEEIDPRNTDTMKYLDKQIRDKDGQLNYDLVTNLVRNFHQTHPPGRNENQTMEEKKLSQFSNHAIQISKGLFLKPEIPYGGMTNPELHKFVSDSSEDEDSDKEVEEYIKSLSSKDRKLLMKKLGKDIPKKEHKHKHHSHKRRSHSKR